MYFRHKDNIRLPLNDLMEDKKMKTIAYNPQREIVTALFVLLISFTLLTAARAQEIPKLTIGSQNVFTMVEEKALIFTNSDSTEKNAINNFLVMRIKSWIGDGSYWNKEVDEETIVRKLADNIVKWMSDGSFWGLDSNEETGIEEFALSNKDEMTFSAFDTGIK
jgi:hypothetical protein